MNKGEEFVEARVCVCGFYFWGEGRVEWREEAAMWFGFQLLMCCGDSYCLTNHAYLGPRVMSA